MKRVLRNHDEVAHYWANEIQAEGESGNMFFRNKTIFSYGSHFAIAKHYDNDLVLFTNRGYSVSTSKHIHITRRAIPSNKSILECYDPETPNNPENLSSAIREIEYNLKKAVTARTRKQGYMRTAERVYNDIISLRDRFKIKGWRIPKYDFSIPENVLQVIEERVKKEAAKRKRAEAKQRKQDKLDMVEFLVDVADWKTGKIDSAYTIRHPRFRYNSGKDYCRINGDIVETLRGADAPLKEVKIALKRLKQGKDIKGVKVGHYTILNYAAGVLTVGCHHFPQSEIDYLMKELDI